MQRLATIAPPQVHEIWALLSQIPDPEIPVITISFPRGISTVMFFRLLTLAPFIRMLPSSLMFSRKINFKYKNCFEKFQNSCTMFFRTFWHIRADILASPGDIFSVSASFCSQCRDGTGIDIRYGVLEKVQRAKAQ